jgi:hypothetical protein
LIVYYAHKTRESGNTDRFVYSIEKKDEINEYKKKKKYKKKGKDKKKSVTVSPALYHGIFSRK